MEEEKKEPTVIVMPPDRKSPELLLAWLEDRAEATFGHSWSVLREKALGDIERLAGFKLVSWRDKLIFGFTLFLGLSYALPIAKSIKRATTPAAQIKRLFTGK